MRYGYARVSTTQQDFDGQIAKLKEAGCDKIVADKLSGILDPKKRSLAKLVKQLGPGDYLCVARLDRLGRTARDIHNVVHDIDDAGAVLKVLDNPALTNEGPYGKFLLTILSAVAQLERDMIISRTSEGRIRAKQAGRKFGRKHILTKEQMSHAEKLLAEGKTQKEIGAVLGVSHSTISRFKNGL